MGGDMNVMEIRCSQGALRLLLAWVLGGLLVVPTAPMAADRIFKWVDEHGKTQFGDRPTATRAEEVTVRVPVAQEDAAVRARLEGIKKMVGVLQESRTDENRQKKVVAADKAAKEQRCKDARSRLASMEQSGYLFRTKMVSARSLAMRSARSTRRRRKGPWRSPVVGDQWEGDPSE
jgi:hypothetical protein